MEKILIDKTFGVYQIRNIISGKVKVGSTVRSFSKRWAEWRRDLKAKKANDHLQNAWDKYGQENFVFEILEIIEDNFINKAEKFKYTREREQYWINSKQSINENFGYNIQKNTIVTEGCWSKNPEATKQKLSQKSKSNWSNEDYRNGIKEQIKKRHKNPDYKQKLKNKMKELWQDEEYRKKQSEFLKQGSKPKSEETKTKIGKANKNRKHTEATKQKWREARKGEDRYCNYCDQLAQKYYDKNGRFKNYRVTCGSSECFQKSKEKAAETKKNLKIL